MSFSIEFVSTAADAHKIVEQEQLPGSVKVFLAQALRAFKPEAFVSVRAVGHLFQNDYQRSNADIVVQELHLRTVKP